MDTNDQNGINWLVRESQKYEHPDDFVAFLVSQMRSSSRTTHTLKYTVGALRTALGIYVREQTGETTSSICNFCGKSSEDVHVMMASDEAIICDECAVTALHTISHTKGQWYLRFAFFVFRTVASFGRIFHWER